MAALTVCKPALALLVCLYASKHKLGLVPTVVCLCSAASQVYSLHLSVHVQVLEVVAEEDAEALSYEDLLTAHPADGEQAKQPETESQPKLGTAKQQACHIFIAACPALPCPALPCLQVLVMCR